MTKTPCLIKRTLYSNFDLNFEKNYTHHIPLLLKTLIAATVQLKDEVKGKDFWLKLKTRWLDHHWSKEPELVNINPNIKDVIWSFAYQLGIWDANFNLSNLASKTWKQHLKNLQNSKITNKPFQKYMDVFLTNYLIVYNGKSYNLLKLLLEKLQTSNCNTLNIEKIRTYFNETFNLNRPISLLTTRHFFNLISSSSYVKITKYDPQLKPVELSITSNFLVRWLAQCEDIYHDQPLLLLQSNVLTFNDKTTYLTKTSKYCDEQIKTIKAKPNPADHYLEIDQEHILTYIGGHLVGKKFILDQKMKNFFEPQNCYKCFDNVKFENMFWKHTKDNVVLGELINHLLLAIANPNETFLFAIYDINSKSDCLKTLNDLSQRDANGFSSRKFKIDHCIFKEIKKQYQQISNHNWDQLLEDLSLDYGYFFEENEIFFPPNFYIWKTTTDFDNPANYSNVHYVSINNQDYLLDNLYFKFKKHNEFDKTLVSWNRFRKIINKFVIKKYDLKDDVQLMGSFFININNWKQLEIDDLSKKIHQLVLIYLETIMAKNPYGGCIYNSKFNRINGEKMFWELGSEIFNKDLMYQIEKLL